MKTISTLFVALLIVISTSLADGRNDYLRAAYTAYSANDSNVVLAGILSNESTYSATNLNIAKGTSETFSLEVDNSTELLDVQMNTNARLTYFFTYKKVYIYEFGATKSLRIITIDNDSPFFGISSDGSKIYTYDNKEDYVSIFDALSGERLDRFFVNSFVNNNKLGFFNSSKDEFLLQNGTELYVWSIGLKVQVRKISIPNTSKNFQLINYGNTLVYTIDGEVKLTRSSDGDKVFNKDFGFSDIGFVEFSPNMNYVIVSDFKSFLVYDMLKHEIKVDSRNLNGNGQNLPFYIHVNNDFSKVIGREYFDLYCGRNFEDAIADYAYFIYEAGTNNKVVSAPFGHIPRPEKAIVSKDNKVLVLSGYNIEDGFTNGLVDNQENFIRYINVNMYPETFLEDYNTIAFMEEGVFKVYDVLMNNFLRQFDTEMDSYNDVYFFANGGGRVVITDNNEIKVFDYSTFELLYTFNYSELGLEPTDISFDNNSTISVYSLKRLHKFNTYTGEMSDSPITSIDPANELVDVSISGRYLLYRTTDDEFIVYDNEIKDEVYRYKISEIGPYVKYLKAGFFGNHEIIWIRYEKNPMDTDPMMVKYDFVDDKTEEMFGDRDPIISDDGSLYYSHYCPTKYEIGAIRDPQTSVETTIEISSSVYPNPASDFIQLDYEMSTGISDIAIYNSFGTQVMTITAANISERIDISSLTAGVYFVKVGSKSWKFIKL